MIAYHGSSIRGLKNLTYSEEQSRFGGEKGLKHGAGIYLTTSQEEAKAYANGGSVYTINLSGSVFDSTDKNNLKDFVSLIGSKINFNLNDNKTIILMIHQVSIGVISAINFTSQIAEVILNDQSLYSIVENSFDSDIDLVEPFIQSFFNYDNILLSNNEKETWIISLRNHDKLHIIEELEIE
jgi:hypothetical protein